MYHDEFVKAGKRSSEGETTMITQFEDQLVAVEELIKIATSLSLERDIKNLLDMILTSARKMTRAEAGRIGAPPPLGRGRPSGGAPGARAGLQRAGLPGGALASARPR